MIQGSDGVEHSTFEYEYCRKFKYKFCWKKSKSWYSSTSTTFANII